MTQRDETRTCMEQYNQSVWETLERIRHTADMSHTELAERLWMTHDQYLKAKEKKSPPPVQPVMELAMEIRVPFRAFFDGSEIDYAALARRRRKEFGVLPERYQPGAFSRKRTAMSVLEYVERFHSFWSAESLLTECQLDRTALQNPDEMVNIRLISDFLQKLADRGMSADTFYRMGQMVSNFSVNHPLAEEVKDIECTRKLYEVIVSQHAGHFEFNHVYSIRYLNAESCLVMAEQKDEVRQSLSEKRYGNRAGCHYKAGIFAAFPGFLGRPHAEVTEIACVHDGDPACLLEIKFGPRNPLGRAMSQAS